MKEPIAILSEARAKILDDMAIFASTNSGLSKRALADLKIWFAVRIDELDEAIKRLEVVK